MTTPSQTPEAGGLSETYRFSYESIRNGAPGLSDATCAAIAWSINMKVSLAANVTAASAQAAIDAEKARADRLAKALKETRNRVREWPIDDHETCMCGSPVASHGMGDGHSPVSQGDHAISMIVEAINEALQQETQK